MKTFDIRISEAQHQYLISAMHYLCDHPTCLGADPVDQNEMRMLRDMLGDVSDTDRESDCLHDFTA